MAKASKTTAMAMRAAQWRLTLLWIVGGGLVILLVVTQLIISEIYKGQEEKVAGWLFPNLVPVLSLIITGQAATALMPAGSRAVPGQRVLVDRRFFATAAALSVVYLLLMLTVVLAMPFAVVGEVVAAGAEVSGEPPATEPLALKRADYLGRSSLFLGPVQGLAAAAIGVFFIAKSDEGGAES